MRGWSLFQDGRSSSSAESRSLTSENEEKKSHDELFPVVIAAEPRQDLKEHAYSVYGSPSIDYSKLYSQPGVKLATHNEPLEDGREAPYLAFQRDYFNSASASRSADNVEFPPHNHDARARSDTFGGIRYIEPPNRERTSYYYYSDNSEFYKQRLAPEPTPAVKPTIKTDVVELRSDSLPKLKPLQAQSRKFDDDQEEENQPQPQPQQKQQSGQVNAVVYSYQNEYGQKQKVGIVLDNEDLATAESTLTRAENPPTGPSRPVGPTTPGPETAEPVKIIPLCSGEPSHKDIVSGTLNHVFHGSQGTVYPLGGPYRAPERPKYFPPQNHPPIYKIRPGHLEGVFGPALPPKPSPDIIDFPDDHEYGRPKPESQKANR